MTVSEFVSRINKIAEDIGCDGERIMSHNVRSSLDVVCENSDDEFELVDIDVSIMMGCGCWDGIRLVIKKINQE